MASTNSPGFLPPRKKTVLTNLTRLEAQPARPAVGPPGLRSFAAVGEFYELNPCGGWVLIPRAQNSSSGWVGAPATLLKPPVAMER